MLGPPQRISFFYSWKWPRFAPHESSCTFVFKWLWPWLKKTNKQTKKGLSVDAISCQLPFRGNVRSRKAWLSFLPQSPLCLLPARLWAPWEQGARRAASPRHPGAPTQPRGARLTAELQASILCTRPLGGNLLSHFSWGFSSYSPRIPGLHMVLPTWTPLNFAGWSRYPHFKSDWGTQQVITVWYSAREKFWESYLNCDEKIAKNLGDHFWCFIGKKNEDKRGGFDVFLQAFEESENANGWLFLARFLSSLFPYFHYSFSTFFFLPNVLDALKC